MIRRFNLFVLITFIVMLSACSSGGSDDVPGLPAADTPGDGASSDAGENPPQEEVPAEPAQPANPTYWVQPGVPGSLQQAVNVLFAENGFTPSEDAETADFRIIVNPGGDASLVTGWVYALVAPFATIADDVTWAGFLAYWQNGAVEGVSAFGSPPTLVLSEDVLTLFSVFYGPPADGVPVQTIPSGDPDAVVAAVWNARPSLAIVPFDELDPSLKVITIDGASVLNKGLDLSGYPLKTTIGVQAVGDRGNQVLTVLSEASVWNASNRDVAHMATVVLTGTTALARATAMEIEINGTAFPYEKILSFLSDADILHTSNESSFSPSCPPPEWVGDPEFCSSPNYFPVLQGIGVDIVEVTGNHVNDYGTAGMVYTLGLYTNNGIAYYGGGYDLEDANTTRIITTPDGTRVAFVGCNSVGPYGAFATAESAGAAPCDEDFSGLTAEITALKTNNEADIVVATLQYLEIPRYAASDQQIVDFQRLTAAGADIVSGSQAHQPQGFGFSDGSFIHYGIGNLFFDQMDFIENRQMFADKHILYEWRHISTILFTGMMEDYAQPRPMTQEERTDFLTTIFEASGW